MLWKNPRPPFHAVCECGVSSFSGKKSTYTADSRDAPHKSVEAWEYQLRRVRRVRRPITVITAAYLYTLETWGMTTLSMKYVDRAAGGHHHLANVAVILVAGLRPRMWDAEHFSTVLRRAFQQAIRSPGDLTAYVVLITPRTGRLRNGQPRLLQLILGGAVHGKLRNVVNTRTACRIPTPCLVSGSSGMTTSPPSLFPSRRMRVRAPITSPLGGTHGAQRRLKRRVDDNAPFRVHRDAGTCRARGRA